MKIAVVLLVVGAADGFVADVLVPDAVVVVAPAVSAWRLPTA